MQNTPIQNFATTLEEIAQTACRLSSYSEEERYLYSLSRNLLNDLQEVLEYQRKKLIQQMLVNYRRN